ETTVRIELTGFIKNYFDEHQCADRFGYVRKVNKGLVNNTVSALASMVSVPSETEMPVWLCDIPDGPFIAARNGLLDIGALAENAIRLREPSPLWFSTGRISRGLRQLRT